ncbi:phenylacetate--CoA ligase [Nitriliruptoraceae bacterium ZYF776]|nr:phenylacetate--CoA ligase [Profundirhabdus halotolerans]
MGAITTHRYWNEATQTASREQLDALHLERIRRLVGWAYRNSPLHRRIYDDVGVKPEDIRSWDDYHHRLPFTDKPDYMTDQEASPSGFGGTALPPDRFHQYFHTTGTTGTFLNEAFSQYEMQKAGSQYCYAFWDYGLRPGDSIYFCFNWGMWIGLWSFYWGARNFGLQIVSGGGVDTLTRLQQIVERKPSLVVGTPTYLLHLAEVAEAQGIDITSAGVKMLAGGGEAGLSVPATRQQLADRWGISSSEVMDAYGVGEALFIGQSCKSWGGGVHVIEDVAHSYTVNPRTGAPIDDPDAVGEHVITSYTHFAQPFIKYRTHDLVRLDRSPNHGCGWTWAHMPGVVLGRADFMVTIRGVNVYPTAVENLIGDVEGLSTHYQLHITRERGFDRMLVKVEAASTGANRDALATSLAEHLREQIGVRLETEVLAEGELPRFELKTRRVFDHRDESDRPAITLGR